MIKYKDPPTQYIDQFLKQYGIRQTDPTKVIIIINNKSYLAKSKAFQATVNQLKYDVKEINVNQYTDVIHDLILHQVIVTITINGDGEISTSHDVRRTANSHEYGVKSTGRTINLAESIYSTKINRKRGKHAHFSI